MSYSHVDEAIAASLHRRLERLAIPKHLAAPGTTLAPIFRDREELPASGDLSESIKSALDDSDALIVICSRAAATSRWVNEEIVWFRTSQPEAPVACVIVDGEPGDPSNQCFPEPLSWDVDGHGHLQGKHQEFASADLRPGRDSRHDAVLRIAAGLLRVGFDDLKQRHQQRRIRQLLAVNVVGALVAMALATLTVVAFRASDDAERRQAQAERLVSFMLGDLRAKLEPIGQLDVLDAIGDEATVYFSSLDADDETDVVLLSRAKSLRQVGDLRIQQGRLNDARISFEQALQLNDILHSRAPADPKRLYDLAQSEFWIGYATWRNGDLDNAAPHLQRYLALSRRLAVLDESPAHLLEVAYGLSNLGTLALERGELAAAAASFEESIGIIRALLAADATSPQLRRDLAQVLAWQAQLHFDGGAMGAALPGFREQSQLLAALARERPDDRNATREHALAMLNYGEVLALRGERSNALIVFEDANRIFEDLAQYDSSNLEWQQDVARSRWYLGRALEAETQHERAFEHYTGALDAIARAVGRGTADTRWRRDLGQTLATALRFLREHGQIDQARHLDTAYGTALASAATDQALGCERELLAGATQPCRRPETEPGNPTNTRARLARYRMLRSSDEPGLDAFWQEITSLGIRDRAFVDTL